MELLTFIGQAARRKGDYIERAEGLAESNGSLEKLEEEMEGRADALSRKLASGKITFSEFQRAAAEDTLVSSLAAVKLGYGRDSGLTDSAYAETMGAMQYLWKFFEDIKRALEEGKIEYGSAAQNFADAEETEDEILDEIPESALSPTPGASTPASWGGLRSRLVRYLVTPAYRWYNAGRMARRRESGATEMRRLARNDKRVCQDCREYDSAGWQPIGSLPVPGTRCRCHDRCRCVLDFR